MNQELNEIISEISHAETSNSMKMSDDLKTDFDILPQDFISYAEVDLASSYEHNIINALSNSKRALDCQLDILLLSFGYYKKSQKDQWSFTKKIDLMNKLGLIRYSDESTPVFRDKVPRLFRSKVRQPDRPYISVSKRDTIQT